MEDGYICGADKEEKQKKEIPPERCYSCKALKVPGVVPVTIMGITTNVTTMVCPEGHTD